MAKCFVSYLDTSGIRHTIEVDAENMYEPQDWHSEPLREHKLEPGAVANLDVEEAS